MAPINVGLMGYGFSAKCFHLPFILPNPDFKVYAFLQRAQAPKDTARVEPGKHCTVDYPDAKHYRTADDFFADPNIDLVIISTHHDTHAQFAERGLLAGKHVVVEKPFTRDTAEADRLIEVGKKSGKILTVFQNRRYDSDFRTLQSLVEQSALGKITECEIHYDFDFPPWLSNSPDYSPGDGMMFGIGSHTIDQALLLFGTPTSVTGFYRSLREVEGETKSDDTFTVILQYSGDKKNLLVTIKTSVVAIMQYPLKFYVRGYDGSFVKYGDDKQESQIMSGQTTATPDFGIEPESTYGLLTTKKKIHESQVRDEGSGKWVGKFPSLKGDYLGYYVDVGKAIRGEAEVKVTPEHARNGIRLIEIARESAEKGCTLPFN